ncbi:hypothetical protein CONPUDRAFT_163128 [Coniophora puteana RWD-64-598 SS2]|uniref:Uncharacterized protein n=1 Tax=Coniophora puteana (strain RWD-64-598) TaxID=741705 RepID=A0A5M3MZ20_CONPW|nr:uncharacterized protein CONPUDRAFT_163128 [Coniophora puteana RWD-64-598 SS2]EIW83851.1 hypothetical protein CONPUDRAFT_163128 [Coniophora puteana RWD-64-598 SS2]
MSAPDSRFLVMDLPPEVLLMVFNYASQPREIEEGELENEASEAMVYHAQHVAETTASTLPFVCRRWLDVAAMEPAYWKNLDINIDGPSFIPTVIETFFIASRDSPIAVTIAPPLGSLCSLTASQEHARWQFIMNHMSPHLGRLTRLCITTYYRSTTVLISRFLDGATLCLDELKLTSRRTDDTSPLQITSLNLASSRLNELYVDAGSFVDLMDANIQWPSDEPSELNLKRYRPTSPALALSPARLMAALQKFEQGRSWYQLAIDDVQFDPHDPPPDDIALREVSHIELVDLDGPFMPMICEAARRSSRLDSNMETMSILEQLLSRVVDISSLGAGI